MSKRDRQQRRKRNSPAAGNPPAALPGHPAVASRFQGAGTWLMSALFVVLVLLVAYKWWPAHDSEGEEKQTHPLSYIVEIGIIK